MEGPSAANVQKHPTKVPEVKDSKGCRLWRHMIKVKTAMSRYGLIFRAVSHRDIDAQKMPLKLDQIPFAASCPQPRQAKYVVQPAAPAQVTSPVVSASQAHTPNSRDSMNERRTKVSTASSPVP